MSAVLTAFLVSAAAAWVVTPALARACVARGMYGHARIREGVEHKPVPRLGGIAVCVAMTAGLLAALPLAVRHSPGTAGESVRFFAGLLLAGWVLFAAGLVDDLRNLTPLSKLLAQVAAALAAFLFHFRIEHLGIGSASYSLEWWLSLPLTVLWIVAVTNAFNLIDGLDGLATGIALVALSTTFAVAAALGNWQVALVCAALGGALLGFVRYNVRPARIFLGDSGSLLVGFMLAVLSVAGSTKSATAVLSVVPILVVALPLLDTSLAIVRRWLRGTPIFHADERHLHHRLVAIGLTHTRAVVLLFLLAAGLAMFGLVLFFAPQSAVGAISVGGGLLCVALLLFGIKRLGYHEFVEAGAVVAGAGARMRRAIRDRIHARDVAHVILQAETEVHLRAILADNAEVMGLVHATFCREHAPDDGRGALPPEHAATALRLDCPVGGGAEDPFVLRVWFDSDATAAGAVPTRTVQVLAEAVREWLATGPPARPVPRPHPDAGLVPPRPAGSSAW